MSGDTGHAGTVGDLVSRPDRRRLFIIISGFAVGAAVGLGLPALVAYQFRGYPVEIPSEWRTAAPTLPPTTGDPTAAGTSGSRLP